jgi:tetratricopeptide (TPR) repeat protein
MGTRVRSSKHDRGGRRARSATRKVTRTATACLALAVVAAALVAWHFLAGKRGGNSRVRPIAESVATALPAQREALLLADRLLADFPEDPEALFLRGLLLRRWEQNDEAVRCWEACLGLAPGFAAAYACLGQRALDLGDYQQALAPLSKAIQIDPKLPRVGLCLGQALRGLGRERDAVDVLEQYVAKWPGETDAYIELGEAQLKLAAYPQAEACLTKAVELRPISPRAYFGLMTIASRRGDVKKASEFQAKYAETKKTAYGDLRASRVGDVGQSDLPRDLAESYAEAGRFYAGRGQISAADEFRRKAAAADPRARAKAPTIPAETVK